MNNVAELFKKFDPKYYHLIGGIDRISFLDTALLACGYEPIHEKLAQYGKEADIPFCFLPFEVQKRLEQMSQYIKLKELPSDWANPNDFKNKHQPENHKYGASAFFEMHFDFGENVSPGDLYWNLNDQDICAPKDVTTRDLVKDVQLMNKMCFKELFAVMMWGCLKFLWPSTTEDEEKIWSWYLGKIGINRSSLKLPSSDQFTENVVMQETVKCDEVSNSTSDLETKKEILYDWTQRVEFITHCHKSLNTLIRPINQQGLIHPICQTTRTWMDQINVEMTTANFKYVWDVITGLVRWDPKRDSQIHGSMDYFRERYFKPNK